MNIVSDEFQVELHFLTSSSPQTHSSVEKCHGCNSKQKFEPRNIFKRCVFYYTCAERDAQIFVIFSEDLTAQSFALFPSNLSFLQ